MQGPAQAHARAGCLIKSQTYWRRRLDCTLMLCCTIAAMPLFWLAIMMPAADCPTLVIMLDRLKTPPSTLTGPPAPPAPP